MTIKGKESNHVFDRVMGMYNGIRIDGVYIIIKNNTNHVISDLTFKVADREKQKAGKLKNDAFNQCLIINSDLLKDEDLIIEDGNGKKFVFEKMVNKRHSPDALRLKDLLFNYHYHFLKIEEGEDGIHISLDEEGREKFF